jgi:hypothetical protein
MALEHTPWAPEALPGKATEKATWIATEVQEALEQAGLPIPEGRRVTEQGYTTPELRAIERHRTRTRTTTTTTA